jgi:hypothetical protein
MSIEIKEIKNDKIQIKSLKMATNKPIPGNDGRVFERYGFCLLVCGPPASGKSSLIFSQLTNSGGLFYKKFHKVYIFSPSLNTIEKKIEIPEEQKFDTFDVDALQDIVDRQKQNSDDPDEILLIFDDLLTEISKDNSRTFLKTVFNRRHLHISIIVMTQVFNKIKSHMRKAFDSFIILRTNNKKEIEFVRDEITQYDRKEWNEIIKYCFDSPHSFIMLKLDGNIYKNFNKLEITEIEQ